MVMTLDFIQFIVNNINVYNQAVVFLNKQLVMFKRHN